MCKWTEEKGGLISDDRIELLQAEIEKIDE